MSAATITPERKATAGDWIAVMAGIVGAFMAALDISVTNASLPQIQGEIGATGTEGTWISTGYLVSETIMIPLAAWLVRLFGLRRFLLICAVLFTAFSLLCGTAPSLVQMIVGRVGQGFFGGALIPTAMTIIALKLPPKQQPVGLALFGSTVILAPVFGPLLGGWLTENVGWHWLFFLNVPVGGVLVALLLLGLKPERSHLEDWVKADWLGIAGLAITLGALTVLLEEGQRERWFESQEIVMLAVASVVGAAIFTFSQFTQADPVVRLRLLRDRSFSGALIVSVIMGGAFYTVLYIIPVFLGAVAGYNAEQTGTVAMYSGAAAFFVMPIAPFLSKIVDLRLLVAVGLFAFAVSCWMDLGLTAETGRDQFFWSQAVRGIGQTLIFFPLSQAALAGIAEADAADASGLFNMMRNIGGSFGLALASVLIERRVALHGQALSETVTANSTRAADRLGAMAGGLQGGGSDMALGQMRALRQLGGMLQQQALVMTYADCFWVFGVAMLAAIPAVLLLKAPKPGAAMAIH